MTPSSGNFSRGRIGVLVAAVAVLAVTSGCGVSGATLRPGVAAEVDGTKITLDQVDTATQAYCKELSSQPSPTPVTGATAREGMLQGYLFRAIADNMNSSYHVKPGAYYSSQISMAKGQLTDLSSGEYDDVVDPYTGFAYFVDLVSQFGAVDQKLASSSDQQTKFSAGLPLVVSWLKDHPVDTDPSFPTFEGIDPAKGVLSQRTDLASAVSPLAKTADEASVPTPTGAATAYPSSLPSSQQCG